MIMSRFQNRNLFFGTPCKSARADSETVTFFYPSIAYPYTQRDTKVTTVGTLSGFQEFFLQPIIKDRPNNKSICVKQAPYAAINITSRTLRAWCVLWFKWRLLGGLVHVHRLTFDQCLKWRDLAVWTADQYVAWNFTISGLNLVNQIAFSTQ